MSKVQETIAALRALGPADLDGLTDGELREAGVTLRAAVQLAETVLVEKGKTPMNRAELLAVLADAPDDAEIVISDDEGTREKRAGLSVSELRDLLLSKTD